MNSIEKVNHRSAWTPESLLAQTDHWVYRLEDEDIAELDHALQHVAALGVAVPNFDHSDFPIPGLLRKLKPFKGELEGGLGLLQVKGLPVEQYSKDQASAIFWGLGIHFGKPWAQNDRGHLLGDVIDEGKSINDASTRGYQTAIKLGMHTDGADMVALLFLKQAPVGGESTVVSAISVFNKMAAEHPDYLQHLIDTEWCIDWRNEERPGDPPFHRGRVFSRTANGVTCFALTHYIFSAQRHSDVPRLSEFDRAAITSFEAMCEDPSLLVTFKQEPGDIFFLNNHLHAHGRSTFTDSEDPQHRRHLRRLWLQSAAWDQNRPAEMQRILATSRHWESSSGERVKMWDHGQS